MVTGPRNIGDLMESLKTNEFSKHFLLGNNIVGPTGAEAIASFIEAFPNRIETWYLAGNCIDAPSFTRLVDAMLTSPIITNIWLKRNPLGASSAPDLFRLITQSPNLRTLDLDQTELGDEGVATLFSLLTTHNHPLPLRNLYLNATGIGPLAAAQISAYLSTPSCSLTSLYLANNPLGPAAALLAPGLATTTTLTRLSLQSCGLSDAPVATLLSALQSNPQCKISALDFGQSYATEDLRTRYNWLTTALPFADFVASSATLRYLNVSHNPLSQTSVNVLLQSVSESPSMMYLDRAARPLVRGEQDWASVKAGQECARLTRLVRERLRANVEREIGAGYEEFEAEEKRFLMSPRDVRLIDSVYRNRAAGAAKRGEGRLKKVWEEGDDTLKMVVGEGMKVVV
jgi:Ran GTPase-activating protein (RanGAP) involved in mRNA processing and transport